MNEKQYDNLMNEGGECYNPIREKRLAAERAAAAAAPRTEYDILRELNALDCSIARESGIDNTAKIAALKAELAAMQSASDAAFLSVWTREETEKRRAAWNAEIRAIAAKNNGKIPSPALSALIKRIGFGIEDIKRAKKLHNIA